jgi:translation initiation factor 3 subunit A
VQAEEERDKKSKAMEGLLQDHFRRLQELQEQLAQKKKSWEEQWEEVASKERNLKRLQAGDDRERRRKALEKERQQQAKQDNFKGFNNRLQEEGADRSNWEIMSDLAAKKARLQAASKLEKEQEEATLAWTEQWKQDAREKRTMERRDKRAERRRKEDAERDAEREREREKDRARSKERKERKEREREREKSKERERERRDREREKERERERENERAWREQEREREKETERERDRERQREREKGGERERERKEREREREKDKDREREDEKENDRDRDFSRERDRGREQDDARRSLSSSRGNKRSRDVRDGRREEVRGDDRREEVRKRPDTKNDNRRDTENNSGTSTRFGSRNDILDPGSHGLAVRDDEHRNQAQRVDHPNGRLAFSQRATDRTDSYPLTPVVINDEPFHGDEEQEYYGEEQQEEFLEEAEQGDARREVVPGRRNLVVTKQPRKMIVTKVIDLQQQGGRGSTSSPRGRRRGRR